ncbi:MAG: hypothetical protein R3190_12295 [Thermoanaerobaculia bacterium]|nr:hypothetical protein [Thermoanaerobaculia bacterium]
MIEVLPRGDLHLATQALTDVCESGRRVSFGWTAAETGRYPTSGSQNIGLIEIVAQVLSTEEWEVYDALLERWSEVGMHGSETCSLVYQDINYATPMLLCRHHDRGVAFGGRRIPEATMARARDYSAAYAAVCVAAASKVVPTEGHCYTDETWSQDPLKHVPKLWVNLAGERALGAHGNAVFGWAWAASVGSQLVQGLLGSHREEGWVEIVPICFQGGISRQLLGISKQDCDAMRAFVDENGDDADGQAAIARHFRRFPHLQKEVTVARYPTGDQISWLHRRANFNKAPVMVRRLLGRKLENWSPARNRTQGGPGMSTEDEGAWVRTWSAERSAKVDKPPGEPCWMATFGPDGLVVHVGADPDAAPVVVGGGDPIDAEPAAPDEPDDPDGAGEPGQPPFDDAFTPENVARVFRRLDRELRRWDDGAEPPNPPEVEAIGRRLLRLARNVGEE